MARAGVEPDATVQNGKNKRVPGRGLTVELRFTMSTRLVFAMIVSARLALGDFSYDSTTTITGGVLIGVMKMAGTFSKDARKALEPIPTTTIVKGNRMITRTSDSTQIIDLDKETITHVDFAKRSYSVTTFAEMKQAMEDMAKKMNQRGGGADPAEMQFDMKMRDTGQQRTIAGNSAHEVIMTMKLQGQDAKSGQKGGLDMTNDMWVAPAVPGYAEARDFQIRMAQKLNWTPGASPMLNRPDVQRAMAEMAKSGGKLDGMVVQANIQMGGSMEGMPAAGSRQSAGNQSNTVPPPSVSEALGSALGSRLGLGGLGRRKKEQPAADSAPAADGSGAASGNLLEMTTQVVRYSASPVDASQFEVPAGFTQVQENALGQRRR